MAKDKNVKPVVKNDTTDGLSRRDFFKIGAATAAIGAAGTATASREAVAEKLDEQVKKGVIREVEDFPYEIREDYKPRPSYSTVHAHAFFGRQLEAMGLEVDKEALAQGDVMLENSNYHFHPDKKGFDQLSKATMAGAWAISNATVGPSPGAVAGFGLHTWRQKTDKDPRALMDHDWVRKEKYTFPSKEEAASAIKRAARLYGADLVGITKRDPRWDYSEFFNYIPEPGREMFPMPPRSMEEFEQLGEYMKNWTPDKWTYGWEKAGFTPKTVVVLAFEMDYEGIASATSEIASAAVGEGYTRMAKTAYQLAVFFRQLGYNAIPCGNDTGMSIPYAIAAGLGEGSRMGQLINYKYGPRVRLAKVYTDFELTAYDKPKLFGVLEFCKRCKRCAEACPSKAISFDDEPSFEPTHEHKDNAYFNFTGVKKWYLDSKLCFKQWAEGDVDCTNCLCSCPYNKPNFWHHRLVDSINKAMPGPVHSVMKELDEVFGYGNVEDEAAVDAFFDPQGRDYDGFGS